MDPASKEQLGVYIDYVSSIGKGKLDYENPARDLATQYDFPLEPLEKALEEGRRIEKGMRMISALSDIGRRK